MKWSIQNKQLTENLKYQLKFFSAGKNIYPASEIKEYVSLAMARVEKCFKGIGRKYYKNSDQPFFSHLHSDHYAKFLYFFGNSIFKNQGNKSLMEASFALNKQLHGIDVYPAISLPEIFLLVHPVGTVLGRATYKNYFAAYQGVTVGSTEAGVYPEFNEGTILFSGASVLGNCKIGQDVIFGANSFIINTNVPARTTVTGVFPFHRFTALKQNVKNRFFFQK